VFKGNHKKYKEKDGNHEVESITSYCDDKCAANNVTMISVLAREKYKY
jgi:hypothetical protein